MSEERREGHYRDKYGDWKPDRRSGQDRRLLAGKSEREHERRRMFRRRADREILNTDKGLIKEALEDFAEEHGGRL